MISQQDINKAVEVVQTLLEPYIKNNTLFVDVPEHREKKPCSTVVEKLAEWLRNQPEFLDSNNVDILLSSLENQKGAQSFKLHPLRWAIVYNNELIQSEYERIKVALENPASSMPTEISLQLQKDPRLMELITTHLNASIVKATQKSVPALEKSSLLTHYAELLTKIDPKIIREWILNTRNFEIICRDISGASGCGRTQRFLPAYKAAIKTLSDEDKKLFARKLAVNLICDFNTATNHIEAILTTLRAPRQRQRAYIKAGFPDFGEESTGVEIFCQLLEAELFALEPEVKAENLKIAQEERERPVSEEKIDVTQDGIDLTTEIKVNKFLERLDKSPNLASIAFSERADALLQKDNLNETEICQLGTYFEKSLSGLMERRRGSTDFRASFINAGKPESDSDLTNSSFTWTEGRLKNVAALLLKAAEKAESTEQDNAFFLWNLFADAGSNKLLVSPYTPNERVLLINALLDLVQNGFKKFSPFVLEKVMHFIQEQLKEMCILFGNDIEQLKVQIDYGTIKTKINNVLDSSKSVWESSDSDLFDGINEEKKSVKVLPDTGFSLLLMRQVYFEQNVESKIALFENYIDGFDQGFEYWVVKEPLTQKRIQNFEARVKVFQERMQVWLQWASRKDKTLRKGTVTENKTIEQRVAEALCRTELPQQQYLWHFVVRYYKQNDVDEVTRKRFVVSLIQEATEKQKRGNLDKKILSQIIEVMSKWDNQAAEINGVIQLINGASIIDNSSPSRSSIGRSYPKIIDVMCECLLSSKAEDNNTSLENTIILLRNCDFSYACELWINEIIQLKEETSVIALQKLIKVLQYTNTTLEEKETILSLIQGKISDNAENIHFIQCFLTLAIKITDSDTIASLAKLFPLYNQNTTVEHNANVWPENFINNNSNEFGQFVAKVSQNPKLDYTIEKLVEYLNENLFVEASIGFLVTILKVEILKQGADLTKITLLNTKEWSEAQKLSFLKQLLMDEPEFDSHSKSDAINQWLVKILFSFSPDKIKEYTLSLPKDAGLLNNIHATLLREASKQQADRIKDYEGLMELYGTSVEFKKGEATERLKALTSKNMDTYKDFTTIFTREELFDLYQNKLSDIEKKGYFAQFLLKNLEVSSIPDDDFHSLVISYCAAYPNDSIEANWLETLEIADNKKENIYIKILRIANNPSISQHHVLMYLEQIPSRQYVKLMMDKEKLAFLFPLNESLVCQRLNMEMVNEIAKEDHSDNSFYKKLLLSPKRNRSFDKSQSFDANSSTYNLDVSPDSFVYQYLNTPACWLSFNIEVDVSSLQKAIKSLQEKIDLLACVNRISQKEDNKENFKQFYETFFLIFSSEDFQHYFDTVKQQLSVFQLENLWCHVDILKDLSDDDGIASKNLLIDNLVQGLIFQEKKLSIADMIEGFRQVGAADFAKYAIQRLIEKADLVDAILIELTTKANLDPIFQEVCQNYFRENKNTELTQLIDFTRKSPESSKTYCSILSLSGTAVGQWYNQVSQTADQNQCAGLLDFINLASVEQQKDFITTVFLKPANFSIENGSPQPLVIQILKKLASAGKMKEVFVSLKQQGQQKILEKILENADIAAEIGLELYQELANVLFPVESDTEHEFREKCAYILWTYIDHLTHTHSQNAFTKALEKHGKYLTEHANPKSLKHHFESMDENNALDFIVKKKRLALLMLQDQNMVSDNNFMDENLKVCLIAAALGEDWNEPSMIDKMHQNVLEDSVRLIMDNQNTEKFDKNYGDINSWLGSVKYNKPSDNEAGHPEAKIRLALAISKYLSLSMQNEDARVLSWIKAGLDEITHGGSINLEKLPRNVQENILIWIDHHGDEPLKKQVKSFLEICCPVRVEDINGSLNCLKKSWASCRTIQPVILERAEEIVNYVTAQNSQNKNQEMSDDNLNWFVDCILASDLLSDKHRKLVEKLIGKYPEKQIEFLNKLNDKLKKLKEKKDSSSELDTQQEEWERFYRSMVNDSLTKPLEILDTDRCQDVNKIKIVVDNCKKMSKDTTQLSDVTIKTIVKFASQVVTKIRVHDKNIQEVWHSFNALIKTFQLRDKENVLVEGLIDGLFTFVSDKNELTNVVNVFAQIPDEVLVQIVSYLRPFLFRKNSKEILQVSFILLKLCEAHPNSDTSRQLINELNALKNLDDKQQDFYDKLIGSIMRQIENPIIEKRRDSDAGSVEGMDARFLNDRVFNLSHLMASFKFLNQLKIYKNFSCFPSLEAFIQQATRLVFSALEEKSLNFEDDIWKKFKQFVNEMGNQEAALAGFSKGLNDWAQACSSWDILDEMSSQYPEELNWIKKSFTQESHSTLNFMPLLIQSELKVKKWNKDLSTKYLNTKKHRLVGAYSVAAVKHRDYWYQDLSAIEDESEKNSFVEIRNFILSHLLEDYNDDNFDHLISSMYHQLLVPQNLTQAKECFQLIIDFLNQGGTFSGSNKEKAIQPLLNHYAQSLFKMIDDEFKKIKNLEEEKEAIQVLEKKNKSYESNIKNNVNEIKKIQKNALLEEKNLWSQYTLLLETISTYANVDAHQIVKAFGLNNALQDPRMKVLQEALNGMNTYRRIKFHVNAALIKNINDVKRNLSDWFSEAGVADFSAELQKQDRQDVLHLAYLEIHQKWVLIGYDVNQKNKEPVIFYYSPSDSPIEVKFFNIQTSNNDDVLNAQSWETILGEEKAIQLRVLSAGIREKLREKEPELESKKEEWRETVKAGIDLYFPSDTDAYCERSKKWIQLLLDFADSDEVDEQFKQAVMIALLERNGLDQSLSLGEKIITNLEENGFTEEKREAINREWVNIKNWMKNPNAVSRLAEQGATLTFEDCVTKLQSRELAMVGFSYDDNKKSIEDNERDTKKITGSWFRAPMTLEVFNGTFGERELLVIDARARFFRVDGAYYYTTENLDCSDKESSDRVEQLNNCSTENQLEATGIKYIKIPDNAIILSVKKENEYAVDLFRNKTLEGQVSIVVTDKMDKDKKIRQGIQSINGLNNTKYLEDKIQVFLIHQLAQLTLLEEKHARAKKVKERAMAHRVDTTIKAIVTELRESSNDADVEIKENVEKVLSNFVFEGIRNHSALAAWKEGLASYFIGGDVAKNRSILSRLGLIGKQHLASKALLQEGVFTLTKPFKADKSIYVYQGTKRLKVADVSAIGESGNTYSLVWLSDIMRFKAQLSSCDLKLRKAYNELENVNSIIQARRKQNGDRASMISERYGNLLEAVRKFEQEVLDFTAEKEKATEVLAQFNFQKRSALAIETMDFSVGTELYDAKGNVVGYVNEKAELAFDNLYDAKTCWEILLRQPHKELEKESIGDILIADVIKRGLMASFYHDVINKNNAFQGYDIYLKGLPEPKKEDYIANKKIFLRKRFLKVICSHQVDLNEQDCVVLAENYAIKQLLKIFPKCSLKTRKNLLMQMILTASHASYFTEPNHRYELFDLLRKQEYQLTREEVLVLIKKIEHKKHPCGEVLKQIVQAAFSMYAAEASESVKLSIVNELPLKVLKELNDLSVNISEIRKNIFDASENMIHLNEKRFKALTKHLNLNQKQQLFEAFLKKHFIRQAYTDDMDNLYVEEGIIAFFRGLGETTFWNAVSAVFPKEDASGRDLFVNKFFSSPKIRTIFVQNLWGDHLGTVMAHDVGKLFNGNNQNKSRYTFFNLNEMSRAIDLYKQEHSKDLELFLRNWTMLWLQDLDLSSQSKSGRREKPNNQTWGYQFVLCNSEPVLSSCEEDVIYIWVNTENKLYYRVKGEKEAFRLDSDLSDNEIVESGTIALKKDIKEHITVLLAGNCGNTGKKLDNPDHIDCINAIMAMTTQNGHTQEGFVRSKKVDRGSIEMLPLKEGEKQYTMKYKNTDIVITQIVTKQPIFNPYAEIGKLATLVGNDNFNETFQTKYWLGKAGIEKVLQCTEGDFSILYDPIDGKSAFCYDAAVFDFSLSLGKKWESGQIFDTKLIDYLLCSGPKDDQESSWSDWKKALNDYMGSLYVIQRDRPQDIGVALDGIQTTLARVFSMGGVFHLNGFNEAMRKENLLLLMNLYYQHKGMNDQESIAIRNGVRAILGVLFRSSPVLFFSELSSIDRFFERSAAIEILELKDLLNQETKKEREERRSNRQWRRAGFNVLELCSFTGLGLLYGLFSSKVSLLKGGLTGLVAGGAVAATHQIVGGAADDVEQVYQCISTEIKARWHGLTPDELDFLRNNEDDYTYEEKHTGISGNRWSRVYHYSPRKWYNTYVLNPLYALANWMGFADNPTSSYLVPLTKDHEPRRNVYVTTQFRERKENDKKGNITTIREVKITGNPDKWQSVEDNAIIFEQVEREGQTQYKCYVVTVNKKGTAGQSVIDSDYSTMGKLDEGIFLSTQALNATITAHSSISDGAPNSTCGFRIKESFKQEITLADGIVDNNAFLTLLKEMGRVHNEKVVKEHVEKHAIISIRTPIKLPEAIQRAQKGKDLVALKEALNKETEDGLMALFNLIELARLSPEDSVRIGQKGHHQVAETFWSEAFCWIQGKQVINKDVQVDLMATLNDALKNKEALSTVNLTLKAIINGTPIKENVTLDDSSNPEILKEMRHDLKLQLDGLSELMVNLKEHVEANRLLSNHLSNMLQHRLLALLKTSAQCVNLGGKDFVEMQEVCAIFKTINAHMQSLLDKGNDPAKLLGKQLKNIQTGLLFESTHVADYLLIHKLSVLKEEEKESPSKMQMQLKQGINEHLWKCYRNILKDYPNDKHIVELKSQLEDIDLGYKNDVDSVQNLQPALNVEIFPKHAANGKVYSSRKSFFDRGTSLKGVETNSHIKMRYSSFSGHPMRTQ